MMKAFRESNRHVKTLLLNPGWIISQLLLLG